MLANFGQTKLGTTQQNANTLINIHAVAFYKSEYDVIILLCYLAESMRMKFDNWNTEYTALKTNLKHLYQ